MFAQLSAAVRAQPALAAALTMSTRYFAGDLFTQERQELLQRGGQAQLLALRVEVPQPA